MFIKVFNFLLVAGAIQGILFVAIPIFLKRKIGKPIWFLNGTVLFISFNNLQAWMIDKGYLTSIYFIEYFEVPWYMLIVPFFYSFLIHYLQLNKKLLSFLILTLIIFTVEVLIMAFLIVALYGGHLDDIYLKKYIQNIEMLNAVYTTFIFIKAGFLIFKPNDLYNYMLSYDNMKWLKQFIRFGILVIILWIVGITLNALVENNEQKYTYYPLRLASSVLIYWIGYQGLIRYNLSKERISLRSEFTNTDALIDVKNKFQQPSKKNLTTEYESLKKIFDDAQEYILKNQLFTNSQLSLTSISEDLKINKNLLSKSINLCSSMNFSDYINNFRVQLAKKMLIDEKYSKYTNTSIGLECGFNSKSTFYTSFKKLTGSTPLQFRNENI